MTAVSLAWCYIYSLLAPAHARQSCFSPLHTQLQKAPKNPQWILRVLWCYCDDLEDRLQKQSSDEPGCQEGPLGPPGWLWNSLNTILYISKCLIWCKTTSTSTSLYKWLQDITSIQVPQTPTSTNCHYAGLCGTSWTPEPPLFTRLLQGIPMCPTDQIGVFVSFVKRAW